MWNTIPVLWKSLIIKLRKPRVNILSDVTRSKRARTAREFPTFFLISLAGFELLIIFFFCSFLNYFSIFGQIDQESASFIDYYVKYCTKNEHNITQLGSQLSQVHPAQFSVCFKTKISIIKTIKTINMQYFEKGL